MTEFVRLHPDEREALAQRVAELLRAGPAAVNGRREPAQLLTASEVAERFGVSREWVYEHKSELGALPMGAGPRPRLRFDPARVGAVLDARSEPVAAPTTRPRRRQRRAAPPADLLPIRGQEA